MMVFRQIPVRYKMEIFGQVGLSGEKEKYKKI